MPLRPVGSRLVHDVASFASTEIPHCLPGKNPVGPTKICEQLGGAAGLAHASEELAKRGMRLVLDFVPNHVGPDHPTPDRPFYGCDL